MSLRSCFQVCKILFEAVHCKVGPETAILWQSVYDVVLEYHKRAKFLGLLISPIVASHSIGCSHQVKPYFIDGKHCSPFPLTIWEPQSQSIRQASIPTDQSLKVKIITVYDESCHGWVSLFSVYKWRKMVDFYK